MKFHGEKKQAYYIWEVLVFGVDRAQYMGKGMGCGHGVGCSWRCGCP